MRSLAFILVVMAALCTQALGRNVDLSTVPKRDTVQLTIYNSEDLTLVRETRKVTFKKGQNPLQFSWANTLIDPTSVELRFLTSADKLEVMDTTFPQDKPQMLYWNVRSDFDGEGTVEITYFTSGISWTADYTAIADKAEKTMGLEGFVRITNNSGEEYEGAQVRLVVGTINLVEKIARLAHISIEEAGLLSDGDKRQVFKDVGGKVSFDEKSSGGEFGMNAEAKEKQIIKEGLSEYFIYTIEGTETIPNGWSKRMRSFEGKDVGFKIQYRYRPVEYGEQLVRMYLLTNDEKSKLGTTPLPNGKVRIFRNNGRDGLSYLTSQEIKYVPIGDKIELNLGADPQVIFELVKLKVARSDIWMQFRNVVALQRVEDGAAKIQVNSKVVGWDEHEVFAQRIRNYSPSAVEVEVRRAGCNGHVDFRSALKPTLFDFHTVQFQATVEAGKKSDLLYELVVHSGRNSKQDHVTLENAEVKP